MGHHLTHTHPCSCSFPPNSFSISTETYFTINPSSIHLSVCLSVLPAHPSISLLVYLSDSLPTSVSLSIYLSVCLSVSLFTHLSDYLSLYHPVYPQSACLPIFQLVYSSVGMSTHLSPVYPSASVSLSICLPACLSVCYPVILSVILSVCPLRIFLSIICVCSIAVLYER